MYVFNLFATIAARWAQMLLRPKGRIVRWKTRRPALGRAPLDGLWQLRNEIGNTAN